MNILEKIFGSAAKVKIIRLFIFNPETAFDTEDIATRTNSKLESVRAELKNLADIKLIKKRIVIKETIFKNKKTGKETIERKKVQGWILDPKFAYLDPLTDFLVYMNPFRHTELIDRMRKVGNVKLLAISGVFIKEPDSRVDLLIVGDDIKKGLLENAIHVLESEIGKELRYAALETEDFKYRMNMCDKLVSDILDFPHEKVINRLNLE
jgi:hypothetical protein